MTKFLSWPKEKSYVVFGSSGCIELPNNAKIAKNEKMGQKINRIF